MKKVIDTSISEFKSLIKHNNLYVDKTRFLYNLITEGGTYFFCARPRRFGKTLTVYTLESIFKGEKELFKDLYIGKTNYDFKEHPIIHIDFGCCQKSNRKETIEWINSRLNNIAKDYGISYNPTSSYDINLENLVKELSKKEKVVVLIDEYDKPLSSNIYNPEVEGIRDVLRGFFEVLKALSGMVRFVFITGVTKYAKVSIFSSMNNLIDISMDDRYANMFGYTQEELEYNFSDYINEGIKSTNLSREEYLANLKEKYDGYCFSPNTETIYNPVSVGQFFFKGGSKFENYWVDTGGNSKLLVDIAKKVNFDVEKNLSEPILTAEINSFDIIEMARTNISIKSYKALLFQSGYLTLSKMIGNDVLFLDYPNKEVRESFSAMLFKDVYLDDKNFSSGMMKYCLEIGDTNGFVEEIRKAYSSLPYHEYRKNDNEGFYHSLFHVITFSLGADVISEVATNNGRIDSLIKTTNDIYIFEFKLNKSAEEALRQIKTSGYAEPFKGEKKKLHLVVISFDVDKRNISSFAEEIIFC